MNLKTTLTDWESVESYISQYTFADAYFLNSLHMLKLSGDFLSKGQLSSKIWLMNLLNLTRHIYTPSESNICVAASWVGILPYMICKASIHTKVTGIDIDPTCEHVAKTFNKYNKYVHKVNDIFNEKYDDYNLIINTSTEHFDLNSWLDIIPKGKPLILQNTDLKDPTHINAHDTIDSFIFSIKQKIIVHKSMELVLPNYKRYMVYATKN